MLRHDWDSGFDSLFLVIWSSIHCLHIFLPFCLCFCRTSGGLNDLVIAFDCSSVRLLLWLRCLISSCDLGDRVMVFDFEFRIWGYRRMLWKSVHI